MGNHILIAAISASLVTHVSGQVTSAHSDGLISGPFPGVEGEAPVTVTASSVIDEIEKKIPEINFDLFTTGAQLQANSIVFDRKEAGPVKLSVDNDDLFLSGSHASLMSADAATDTLNFGSHTIINDGLAVDGPITSNDLTEWWLWSLNTFDTYALEGFWTPQEFSTCGTNGDHFLGGHCKFAAMKATGTYLNLPRHSNVKIRARVHFFDQWTGQSVYMKLRNTIVWTGTKANPRDCRRFTAPLSSQDCANRGVDVCGHSYPDTLSKSLEVAVPHSAPFLAITFGSTFADGADPCTASWGVDDIAIYLQ
ncbi:hypothetical protein BESB_054570 [Besnoitia besnoiti]|uniref:Uncharacterized protein n=1 Tax=Besnoitia besnoiti TaxID=94643 RepID=A0A2A9MIL4_BESBE|nr:hypothetical protein BESB_054570 [Besnoitia besnoiti]PFH35806.1 hypothetical protein BESB_054570 [Besnoitia besnoiti]